MNHLKISFLSLFLAITLSGCAATGTQFSTAPAAKEGKGLIVFYRPKNHQGSGVVVPLQDNDKDIASIQNGQFIFYDAAPGKHEFRTNTPAIDRAVDIDVEAGKSYYLSISMRMGFWVGSWALTRVYDDQAIAELKECCKDGK